MAGRDRLTPDRRALAERYFPLAVRAGQRWGRRLRLPPDDLIGAAALGLCRAALRWEERGIDFATYARSFVRGEILHHLRGERRRPPAAGRPDLVPAPPDPEGVEALWPALASLPEADRDAVILVGAYGRTRDEAAATLGCSRSLAHKAYHRSLARLRAALAP